MGRFAGGCAVAVLATMGVFVAFDLRVNVTASAPAGIYRLESRFPVRGEMVFACAPEADLERARRYLSHGVCRGLLPLVKTVAAVPGDKVAVTRQAVLVNGRPLPGSQPQALDGQGRPMPVAWQAGRLPDGQYWLASPAPRSYDSRYFGPVERGDLLGVATLIWRFPWPIR